LVAIEGEHATQIISNSSHTWLTATTQSGYTGTAYLQALPDIDILLQTSAITDSPAANYPIHFTTPGTYTVWSRSNAPNAAGDSLYVGLNGQLVSVTGSGPGEWDWANQQIPSGEPATLSIGTSGLYTLTASIREDGLRLDRLLLTTDTTYIPSGEGPAETTRQTKGTPGPITTITRTIVYTYDKLHRLTEANYSTGESFAYAYDAVSNRVMLTETTLLSGTLVTTYTYGCISLSRGETLKFWRKSYGRNRGCGSGIKKAVRSTFFQSKMAQLEVIETKKASRGQRPLNLG
jgi:hypothetical protein